MSLITYAWSISNESIFYSCYFYNNVDECDEVVSVYNLSRKLFASGSNNLSLDDVKAAWLFTLFLLPTLFTPTNDLSSFSSLHYYYDDNDKA